MVEEDSGEIPGYMFGAGTSKELKFESAWLVSHKDVLARIERNYGRRFVLSTLPPNLNQQAQWSQ